MHLNFYIGTVIFLCICSATSVIFGIKNSNKFLALKHFYIYPLASFIQIALFSIFTFFKVEESFRDKIAWAAANIFMVIEFTFIYYFFWQILISRVIKTILTIIVPIYITFLLLSWTMGNTFFNFPFQIFVIQSLIILLPVFSYLFELLKNPNREDLSRMPYFWVTVGILIYFSCTLPLFLMKDYIYTKGAITDLNVYSINFLSYGILFLFLTKAYLCPRIETR